MSCDLLVVIIVTFFSVPDQIDDLIKIQEESNPPVCTPEHDKYLVDDNA